MTVLIRSNQLTAYWPIKCIDLSGPCQDLSNLELVSFLLWTLSCTLTEGTDLLTGMAPLTPTENPNLPTDPKMYTCKDMAPRTQERTRNSIRLPSPKVIHVTRCLNTKIREIPCILCYWPHLIIYFLATVSFT